MFFLLNKDIEFSCDEKVMSILGEEYRADYATTLISLAEENNPFSMTICSGFGKTKIEKRIVNIMKFKKSTYVTFLVSTVLVCGTGLVFATENKEFREHEESSMSKVTNSENSEETYVNKSSNSKDVLYTDSGEVSIERSGYNDNRFVISRKGNLLAVNKEQYRTWIE